MTLLTVDRKNEHEGSTCSIRVSTDELIVLMNMAHKALDDKFALDYPQYQHMYNCLCALIEIARYGDIDIIGIENEYYELKAAQQQKVKPTFPEVQVMDC